MIRPKLIILLKCFLVYPFFGGNKGELAVKDLSLCEFVVDYNIDQLITLQLDQAVGRSHFLTFTELNYQASCGRLLVEVDCLE
jgi:hypothetical protein